MRIDLFPVFHFIVHSYLHTCISVCIVKFLTVELYAFIHMHSWRYIYALNYTFRVMSGVALNHDVNCILFFWFYAFDPTQQQLKKTLPFV